MLGAINPAAVEEPGKEIENRLLHRIEEILASSGLTNEQVFGFHAGNRSLQVGYRGFVVGYSILKIPGYSVQKLDALPPWFAEHQFIIS